nr:hypothetical protein [Tanacetum cinerariifolium]
MKQVNFSNETDDADDSDINLTNDEPKGNDDTARYGNLLDETPKNELTDLMSNPVYTYARTTSTVHNPEGKPEKLFPDNVAHHISSPLATITHKFPKNPQPNSLQAKAKKLMQKAKKNMRKINFKKAVAQKFREYDQELEALTDIDNVSHDNQDPLNDREEEKRKKQRKDIGGNLIDMVNLNKLGKGNRRLKGKDWTDNDVMKTNEMVKKTDQTLKRREHLKRLEEYVAGKPKTVNPCTFVYCYGEGQNLEREVASLRDTLAATESHFDALQRDDIGRHVRDARNEARLMRVKDAMQRR